MEKVLVLKRYRGEGVDDILFPNSTNPIEIGAFRYNAKRMGGAPTITASVNYPTCLDDEWGDDVYAEFNGEKYYLKQTPTSSYDNSDTLYKHDVELVSERVALDNVYFFDVVTGSPSESDKPVSNSTKVVFFGGVRDFENRLNASLEYSGLEYRVVVDNDSSITTEERLMSFENQFFSNVLQEIYNVFEVPYYFEGKTIHIGWSNDKVVVPTFSYGVDDALLSITKNNANQKIINRITGVGSSDNIPFYYPNNSPKGEIAAISSNSNLDVTILDAELYSNEVNLDGVITRSNIDYENLEVTHLGESIYSGETFSAQMGYGGISKDFVITFDAKDVGELSVSFESEVTKYTLNDAEINDATFGVRYYMSLRTPSEGGYPFGREVFTSGGLDTIEDVRVPIVKALDGYKLKITVSYAATGKYAGKGGNIVYDASFDFGSESGWTYDGKPIELKDVGLKVDGTSSVGDTITQKLVKYVKTSQNLMPSIYRKNDGEERFYNAINYPYPKPEGFDDTLLNGYYGEDGILRNPLGEYEVEGYIHNDAYKNEDGTYIHFNNPYVEGRPKEHIINLEDIKPTIEGMKVNGLRIDMFSEFAYDFDDNDETVENEEGSEREYVHSFFFAKLRKLDFNLFDHAIENQPMTISFTSGDCGACNFEIGVTEEFPQKNPVQVNPDGTLKRDEKGRVICGQFEDITEDECQPEQQDTINNEVWIALKKEDTTYGILMPKAEIYEKDENGNIAYDENDKAIVKEAGHRPKAAINEDGTPNNEGDTFVILGSNLPLSYITNAEKKLEKELLKQLKDNNDEKFTFSIDFSRIYFEENDVLEQLSENSKIAIMYNDQRYDLYVSSFSYTMSEGDVLPEIRVELDDTLKVSQNAIQSAISQVKSELGRAIGSIDVVGAVNPYFIRKDADDEARGKINFTKGIKFGEGGKVEVLDNNSAKLTIEYLEVTKKASFTSLEIQEKTHVGGQILVTPAAINCGEVEELEDAYRCYFQTKGADGDEIFNQFAVGDQAICQTYNAWGSKYYWRLVVGIGEDYIDLSKTDCDEDSGIPNEGDKIIQLGNRNDATRQNAIVIAAYGEGSPYIIQYKEINSFELSTDKIVTKLSSTENIFTGKVHMEMGSDGLGNLDGLPEFVQSAVEDIEIGGANLLRNSGFNGSYLPKQIGNDTAFENTSELYSTPLDYWAASGSVVRDSNVAISGKEVFVENGSIAQNLAYKIVANEPYVVSFKAKGNSLNISVGSCSHAMVLSQEWSQYEVVLLTETQGSSFEISSQMCTICDLKLEKGNKRTTWNYSPLDDAIVGEKLLSNKYLSEAIKDGSTDILGGLILSNMLMLGNPNKEDNTAGVSGIYNNNDDVAFWAGGTYQQALATIMKYVDNPLMTPTQEELASMAKAVITHGGRAIFNDIIVRGMVYATGGEFKGTVYAENGEFKGTVYAENGEFKGKIKSTEGYIGGFEIGGNRLGIEQGGSEKGMFLYNQFIGFRDDLYGNAEVLLGSNVLPSTGGVAGLAKLSIEGESVFDSFEGTAYGLISSVKGYKYPYAFYCESGVFAGLRPNNRTVSGEETLTEYDHTIFVEDANTTISLPSAPLNGQEYVILTKGENTVIRGNGNTIYSFFGNTEGAIYCHEIAERLEVRLYWNADNSMWWATFVKH